MHVWRVKLEEGRNPDLEIRMLRLRVSENVIDRSVLWLKSVVCDPEVVMEAVVEI